MSPRNQFTLAVLWFVNIIIKAINYMNLPVPILLPNCTCDNLREPTETHGFPHGFPRRFIHGNQLAYPWEHTGLPMGTHGLTHGNPRAYPREHTGLPTGTHGLTHGNPRAYPTYKEKLLAKQQHW